MGKNISILSIIILTILWVKFKLWSQVVIRFIVKFVLCEIHYKTVLKDRLKSRCVKKVLVLGDILF